MTRRAATKSELLARMPRAFRPKLDDGQVRDLGLAHILNLDDIAKGTASEQTLWDWIEAVLTWSRVAEILGADEGAMAEQLRLATRLVQRHASTGRIAFTGPDYQLAKAGIQVMDRLAAVVDRATAIAAVDWSIKRVEAMSAACAQRRAASPEKERAA